MPGGTTNTKGRGAALRALLAAGGPAVLMEAHNALSARIAQEAGFSCVWASGLSISASLGVRDNNEASWTQVLEVVEFMADAVSIPVLVDGDTGFGNFNNARRLVRKLCQRGLAGVVVEDKLFPKCNSFLAENQPLADVDEFCGKVRAMVDARTDSDFVVVARVEALVSGRSMDEALARAEAYRRAGADAVLIHSKKSTADEVLDFARRWDRRAPLIVVPTSYPHTRPESLRDAGVNALICANQSLRACIRAMRETCAEIARAGYPGAVEDRVAPLREVFALTDVAELAQAEARYLPPPRGNRE